MNDDQTDDKSLAERLPIGQFPELKVLTEHMSEARKLELTISPRQAQILAKELESQKYFGPSAALPMVCAGPKCPLAATCPLQQVDRAPLGDKCPIELTLMNKWKDDYLESLGASWEDKIERQAIMDLVETEILRARANGIIANEGFIMEVAIGVNPDTGQPIFTKQKHIALEVSDQMSRRQERLLKSLIATREMKEKLGKGNKNAATKESELLERVRRLKAERIKGVQDATVVENPSQNSQGT